MKTTKTNATLTSAWVVRIEKVPEDVRFETKEKAEAFAAWARGCGYDAQVHWMD